MLEDMALASRPEKRRGVLISANLDCPISFAYARATRWMDFLTSEGPRGLNLAARVVPLYKYNDGQLCGRGPAWDVTVVPDTGRE